MKRFWLFLVSVSLLAGCSTDIALSNTGRDARLQNAYELIGEDLMQESRNLLANYLLLDDYRNRPQVLLKRLHAIGQRDPRPEIIAVLADVSVNVAMRFAGDEDESMPYFLSAAIYSYAYLAAADDPSAAPYAPERVQMIRIYNLATGELFDYLYRHKLHRRDGFSLTAAGGARVNFRTPVYHLPLPENKYQDFLLAGNYTPENFTHNGHSFGLGVPLVGQVDPIPDSPLARYAKQQSLPITLVIRFFGKVEDLSAQLDFIDPRETEKTKIGDNEIPLELDFTTPLAFIASQETPFGYVGYMLNPQKSAAMQGLYLLEPFSPDRIPVVLVHGLMSNTSTWIQMINTLQSDPVLRKNYQFWGFSYSSGNPILFSALLLRNALTEQREKIVKAGLSTDKFDRMVLIGHSMGGLVSKTTIVDTGDQLIELLVPKEERKKIAKLSPEDRKLFSQVLRMSPLSFVRRVIFIAVPHRGSRLAKMFFAEMASRAIDLPHDLIEKAHKIAAGMGDKNMGENFRTGIENLAPDDRSLLALAQIPLSATVPYHSIIGNQKEAGVPGGSDGIVPYESSHLDGAKSELVVKSGHSAQQNPLAIQEIRRILIEHLDSYQDTKVEHFKIRELKNNE